MGRGKHCFFFMAVKDVVSVCALYKPALRLSLHHWPDLYIVTWAISRALLSLCRGSVCQSGGQVSLLPASRWDTRSYQNLSAGFAGDDRGRGKHCFFFIAVKDVVCVCAPSKPKHPSKEKHFTDIHWDLITYKCATSSERERERKSEREREREREQKCSCGLFMSHCVVAGAVVAVPAAWFAQGALWLYLGVLWMRAA